MSGLFSGRSGIGGLASPLGKKYDPVGNATSDALFGKQKDAQRAAAASTSSSATTDETTGGVNAMTAFAGDGMDAAYRREKLRPLSTSAMLGG